MKTILIVFVMLAFPVCGALKADISGPAEMPDGRVDLYDLAILAAEWLQEDFMSLGPELVTNGTFDTDLSGWTPTDGVTWNEDGANASFVTGPESEQTLTQSIEISAGKTYQITMTFPYMSVGYDENETAITIILGGTIQKISNPDNPEYEQNYQVVAGSSDANLVIRENNTALGTLTFFIDNISVREIITDGNVIDEIWPWK